MVANPRFALHFFRNLAAGTLLVICCLPSRGAPQERESVGIERRAEIRRQLEAREHLRDDIRKNHPSWSDSQIDAEIEEMRRAWSGEPRGATQLSGPAAAVRVPLSNTVEEVGATLLKSPQAQGWGYVGYNKGSFDAPRGREVRFSPGAKNPTTVEKFFLVDHSDQLALKSSDFTHQHTIEITPGERLEGQDLTRFYQVNNRFLQDIPAVTKRARRDSLPQPDSGKSSALALVGARLPNGREVLTIFTLSDLERTGAAHGELYTDLHARETVDFRSAIENMTAPKVVTETGLQGVLIEELISSSARRVYYYGDQLKSVDVGLICAVAGSEMVHRSPRVHDDIVHADRRLQQIADRPLTQEQLTIVNGLPQDREAVDAMGAFMGNPTDWLDFGRKVEESLQDRQAQQITTESEFFQELAQGESDLLILVAHSTGSELYLNGKKTSIKELQALPPRPNRPARPRLAILISCDAGKPAAENSGSWMTQLLRGKQIPSLAHTLIEKKFVDKVIAPDHQIKADESLTVLLRALQGARTDTIFRGWRAWAAVWLRSQELPA